jgi:hypothetical protein
MLSAPGKGGPAVRIPFSSRLQLSSNGVLRADNPGANQKRGNDGSHSVSPVKHW